MSKVDAEELAFVRAFAAMKTDLPLIGKTTKAFKYKYATLEGIQQQWEPVFENHGFVLRQSVVAGMNGQFDIVTSKLTHIETGLSEEASITLPVSSDYQAVGSGITYLKRYLLTTLKQPVGEDFDGLKSQRELDDDKKTKPDKSKEESGPHLAYREFLKDTNDLVALESHYKKNKPELDKLKQKSPEIYKSCIAEFRTRKTELQKLQLN